MHLDASCSHLAKTHKEVFEVLLDETSVLCKLCLKRRQGSGPLDVVMVDVTEGACLARAAQTDASSEPTPRPRR